MAFTTLQIATGANYTLETYRRNDPIDQVNIANPFLKFLIDNKQSVVYGNGFYNESIFVSNNSNYQNYFGADPVTYNERDPGRQAKYTYYNNFDGFWFDEDRLAANGIEIDDSGSASPSDNEQQQLINLLDISYKARKASIQLGMALELLQDGSQSAKAAPGLDWIVDTTPATGTVGNIDASSATYWRNNADMGFTAANVVTEMDKMYRACMLYGGMVPDKIFCGAAFLDNYIKYAGVTINRQITGAAGLQKGGVTLDAGVTGVYYKGIELVWDPTFEALDTLLGSITYPWTKRCYMLNSKTLGLKPVKGYWMREGKPEKLPDRFVFYFGARSKYGMTINKRNANAVMSIA